MKKMITQKKIFELYDQQGVNIYLSSIYIYVSMNLVFIFQENKDEQSHRKVSSFELIVYIKRNANIP